MRLSAVSLVLALGNVARAATFLVPVDHPTIQEAIDTAIDGDLILVGPGIYVESIDFLGKAITVRSIEGPGETVIDASPLGAVFFREGESRDSILEGFTVMHGIVVCNAAAPTIFGNEITGSLGGGVAILNSSPDPEGALIAGNHIFENTSTRGGGISVGFSSAVIEGNVITGNVVDAPPPDGLGGGIYVVGSSADSVVIRNNLICGNEVLGCCSQGGGIWLQGGTTDFVFESNTIVDNFATLGGGGLTAFDASFSARNCIVWGNDAPEDPQIRIPAGTVELEYCDVQDGWPGIGNIDADPQFVSGPLGDRYLDVTSPCIDSGDPATSLLDGTTQVEQSPDLGIIDLGFHYPITPRFVRGDCNADATFDISDAVFTLNALFLPGSPAPTCHAACDANHDGAQDISDPIYTLGALFTFGPPPPAPHPDCGHDPSGVAPDCDEFGACP